MKMCYDFHIFSTKEITDFFVNTVGVIYEAVGKVLVRLKKNCSGCYIIINNFNLSKRAKSILEGELD